MRIKGVGLILSDPDGKILLLRELRDKPLINKVAGMLSIPFETIKDGEYLDSALWRAVREEVGNPRTDFSFSLRALVRPAIGVEIEIYVFSGVLSTTGFIAQPSDDDIEHYGWMSLDELRALEPGKLRPEVAPILDAYFGR